MADKKIYKLIILMGLPGSGKTTFAKRYIDTDKTDHLFKKRKINIVDTDSLKNNYPGEEYTKKLRCVCDTNGILILDGLFLTDKDLEKLTEELSFLHDKVKNIEVHYWYPDIKTCLYNDKGRRDKNSQITIKNAETEIPDLRVLCPFKASSMNVTFHTVIKKPEWKYKADELGLSLSDKGYLRSKKYISGGYAVDYRGESTPFDPQDLPEEFEEFDSLLKKVKPDLSFVDYKNIKNECVSVETDIEDDYYGGYMEMKYYKCDVEKVLNMLDDLD